CDLSQIQARPRCADTGAARHCGRARQRACGGRAEDAPPRRVEVNQTERRDEDRFQRAAIACRCGYARMPCADARIVRTGGQAAGADACGPAEGEQAELHLTEADNGFDLSLKMKRANTPAVTAQIAQRAAQIGLIRVTAGGEPIAEFEAPRLKIANADVRLPPEPFLQPTAESERFLQTYVRDNIGKAKSVADLFC